MLAAGVGSTAIERYSPTLTRMMTTQKIVIHAAIGTASVQNFSTVFTA
jgi:hypothetical protein